MSASGQSRRFGTLPSTSGLPPGPDMAPILRNFRTLSAGAQRGRAQRPKLPRVDGVPDRRRPYVFPVRRAVGSGIIGLRRNSIAHHRRSWPAKARCCIRPPPLPPRQSAMLLLQSGDIADRIRNGRSDGDGGDEQVEHSNHLLKWVCASQSPTWKLTINVHPHKAVG